MDSECTSDVVSWLNGVELSTDHDHKSLYGLMPGRHITHYA